MTYHDTATGQLFPSPPRRVSLWLHVDDLPAVHVECELHNPTTGQHTARVVGQLPAGLLASSSVGGPSSCARLVARLSQHAVWMTSLEIDGRRHQLPPVADPGRWTAIDTLTRKALGIA